MQERTFQVGGEKIHGEYHAPVGPPIGGLLLVHGFNSCLQEFGETPQEWAAMGFHVFGYDQRGFGNSEGEDGFSSADRFNADLDAATAELREFAGDLPLGVVAHSFGAAMLLSRLGEPHPFVAACLAHPVLDLMSALKRWQRPVMRVVGRLNARRSKKGKPNLRVNRASNYARLFVDEDLADQSWADARYISSQVNAGVYPLWQSMDPEAWARGIAIPMLGVLGPNDALIPYNDSRRVVQALAGLTECIEHRGGHSCFRDLDASYLAQQAGRWFARHMVKA